MSSLLKLRDIRANTANTNLLTYIVLFLQKNYPDIVTFNKDLSNVEKCLKIMISNVTSDINDMGKGLECIRVEIEETDPVNEKDHFRMKMIEFLDKSDTLIETLKKKMEEFKEHMKQIQVLYGEEKRTFNSQDFLSNLGMFLKQYQETIDSIQKRKEAEEKKKLRDQKKIKALGSLENRLLRKDVATSTPIPSVDSSSPFRRVLNPVGNTFTEEEKRPGEEETEEVTIGEDGEVKVKTKKKKKKKMDVDALLDVIEEYE
jgi:hypothetical protein